MARDAGGPEIAGQVLITPVTDCDFSRSSYAENAEGYVLTTGLMRWFWDHYADENDRTDPRASPIRGNLAGLPPAVVFTAQFDPLRDEGRQYAAALEAAGVATELCEAKRAVHAYDVVEASPIAAAMQMRRLAALRQFFEQA